MRSPFKALGSFSRYSLLSVVALALGLWRESVVSSKFGLSEALDVYVAASAFFLFFGVQLANTLEMVFISKEAKRDTPEATTPQLWQAAKILLLTDLCVCCFLWFGAGALLSVFFPGFSPAQIALGAAILQKLLVAVVLANFCGILKASLNVLGVFAPGLFAGAIVSVCSGGMVILFAEEMALDALVYGFLLGHGVVLAMLVVVYVRTVGWHKLLISASAPAIEERLWQAAGVVLLGEVCFLGFALTERGFASTFPAGTISAFYYAWALYSVPLTLVVVPANTVLYPPLAKAFAQDMAQGHTFLWRVAPGLVLFSLLPVVVTLIWSHEIVELVLLRGRFNAENVVLTAGLLQVLICAMPFVAMGRMFRYSLYAIGSYASASAAQFASLVAIVVLAPILMASHGVTGLAMASAIAVSAQTLVMFLFLRWHST